MKATTLFVFGAGGQLGRELAARADASRFSLHLLAHTDTDIADADAVNRALSAPEGAIVVNAAAYTNVDQAEDHRDEAFRANALGPKVLAEICREKKLPLLHISTDYVFDGRKAGAYREDDPISPINAYGQSKSEGEAAIRETLPRHVILRASWLFGIYGRNFLKTMLKLAGEWDELRVVADQRGCPTSTADVAGAIFAAAPRLAAGENVAGTYHVASREPTSWHGFAVEIVEAQAQFTGRKPAVIPIGTAEFRSKAARPPNSELDSSKFLSVFGYQSSPWRQRTHEAVSALLGRTATGAS